MKFQFIAERVAQFPVRAMCQALDVSPSGYYAWKSRPKSEHNWQDEQLGLRIGRRPTAIAVASMGALAWQHNFVLEGNACLPNASPASGANATCKAAGDDDIEPPPTRSTP
jgi:putative transposase